MIDLLLTLAIITELINQRYDLIVSNIPIMILGIVSLNRKLKANGHGLAD